MNKYNFLRCDTYTHLSDNDKQELDRLSTWHDPYTVAVCQPIDYITEFRNYDHVMYEYQRLVYFFRLMNEPKKYSTNNVMYRFEQHHLLPKKLGGGNDKSNMIHLPVSYHVYIHYLLIVLFEKSHYNFSGSFERIIRGGLSAFRNKRKMERCSFIDYQVLRNSSMKWPLPKLITHVRSLKVTTPNGWIEKCIKSYNAAHKRGLVGKVYDACDIEYENRSPGTLTKEFIIKYARTCKNKKEFNDRDQSMRGAARKLTISEECHLHMYPKMREIGNQIFDLLLTNPDATEYDMFGSIVTYDQKRRFQINKQKFQTWIEKQLELGFYAYDPINHCYHPTDKLNLGGDLE
ncbi:hypothetical protein [Shewanella algae]|uniref:hypothetical protein n=1 Tax=Shewanella algae TaxID=38313 RepID=UPI0039E9D81B